MQQSSIPIAAVLPVVSLTTYITRSFCLAKPPIDGGTEGLQAVMALHIIYLALSMQALLPWLQDGSNEPFGLRVTGLGFAYMAVFPVFMRLRGDELFLEVFAFALPVSWLMGVSEWALTQGYIAAQQFDPTNYSDLNISFDTVPLFVIFLWLIRIFLVVSLGEVFSRRENDQQLGTRIAAGVSAALGLVTEIVFGQKGRLHAWSIVGEEPLFMEYPLYKFAADIFFAAVLMASFRDYVKLVAMRYRSRVFFVVFPAVAYTLMLGTFNQMVQFVHSYL